MKRKEAIGIATQKTLNDLVGVITGRDKIVAQLAAENTLDLVGFSDDEPADSPRPVENSPLPAQKKPGFGPEQTR